MNALTVIRAPAQVKSGIGILAVWNLLEDDLRHWFFEVTSPVADLEGVTGAGLRQGRKGSVTRSGIGWVEQQYQSPLLIGGLAQDVVAIEFLTGGVGGAKLIVGLARVMDQHDLTVIVNTGDDIVMHGLHVSPDPDILIYTLAGAVNTETGWGMPLQLWVQAARLGLRVKEVAERLDISPAFSSSLVKLLVAKHYVTRERDKEDSRVAWVKVTKKGQDVLLRIYQQVQIHVDYFTSSIPQEETEAAFSVMMFYAGVSLKGTKPGTER